MLWNQSSNHRNCSQWRAYPQKIISRDPWSKIYQEHANTDSTNPKITQHKDHALQYIWFKILTIVSSFGCVLNERKCNKVNIHTRTVLDKAYTFTLEVALLPEIDFLLVIYLGLRQDNGGTSVSTFENALVKKSLHLKCTFHCFSNCHNFNWMLV